MLSLIICSKYQHISPKQEENIASTIGDCPYEIVWIDNSHGEYSIFQAYNIGVERAKYPYLCFMHEDIIYHSQDWGQKVLEHLKDKRLGFIGLAGAYFENELSISWDRWYEISKYVCVNYIQSGRKKTCNGKNVIKPVAGSEGLVAVLDGFWMCCRAELFQQDILWDKEHFNGFHQYDSDICMQAVKAGLWNKVIYDVLVEHRSHGNFNESFFEAAVEFHKKWDYMLPVVAPGFQMPKDYVETQRAIMEIGRLQQLANMSWTEKLSKDWSDYKWGIKYSVAMFVHRHKEILPCFIPKMMSHTMNIIFKNENL